MKMKKRIQQFSYLNDHVVKHPNPIPTIFVSLPYEIRQSRRGSTESDCARFF